MTDLGNETEKKFENIWHVLREGKEVSVDERDLTPDEERALRAGELVQEFLLDPLLDERDRLAREIEKRQDRVGRLRMMEGAGRLVAEVAQKVERIIGGDAPCSDLTAGEARRLEELYVRTMPFAVLSPKMEGRLRTEIRKVAVRDHEDGRFQTVDDALKHYGLNVEVKEVE